MKRKYLLRELLHLSFVLWLRREQFTCEIRRFLVWVAVTCTRLLRENGSSDFTLEMRSGDRGVTVLCLQIYSIHPRNIYQVPVAYPQGKGPCTKRAESELISRREGSDVNEKTSQYVGRGNVLRRTMHGAGGVPRGGQTAATRGDPGRLMESWHSGEDLRRCGRH